LKFFEVYILLCSDGSYYTGVTANLTKRIKQHNQGSNRNSYVFNRRPFILVYSDQFTTAYKAIKREKQIKGWSRAKKKALICGNIKLLEALSKCKNQPSR